MRVYRQSAFNRALKNLLITIVSCCSACSFADENVYILGNSSSNDQVYIWVVDTTQDNAVTTISIPDSQIAGGGNSIAVCNGIAYTVGFDLSGPVLWVTNLQSQATTIASLFDVENISGVTVSTVSNKVYSVGQANTGGAAPDPAGMWICDLDGSNAQKIVLTEGGLNNPVGFSVATMGSRVYVVGQDDGNPENGTLWVTDLQGNIQTTVTLPDSADYQATYVTVSTDTVYISEGGNGVGFWTTNLQGGDVSAQQTYGLSTPYNDLQVSSVNNNLYVAGQNSSDHATLLIVTPPGLAQEFAVGSVIAGNTEGYGIALSSSNAYIAGYNSNTYNGYLWTTDLLGNNVGAPLLIDTNVVVKSVTLPITSTNPITPAGSLVEAIQRYNPVKYLKGIL